MLPEVECIFLYAVEMVLHLVISAAMMNVHNKR